uniref:Uncharacterized protein n=1 Tax=Timema cristinae TaxID=61476 RepID=A0A7R9DHS9_TIMCR|nr:unnamed protein product [Timema cristinae]
MDKDVEEWNIVIAEGIIWFKGEVKIEAKITRPPKIVGGEPATVEEFPFILADMLEWGVLVNANKLCCVGSTVGDNKQPEQWASFMVRLSNTQKKHKLKVNAVRMRQIRNVNGKTLMDRVSN